MDDAIPFPIGTTYWNGDTTQISTTDPGGEGLLGTKYRLRDTTRANGRVITLMIVRNTSGGALLPKRAVQHDDSKPYGTAVNAYARSYALPVAGVVDDQLPAAGVASNDIFYVVVDGPCLMVMPYAETGDISFGDPLCSQTAAGTTSASTAIGRPIGIVATTTSYTLATMQALNQIGRAMSACTSSGTGNSFLVNVGVKV